MGSNYTASFSVWQVCRSATSNRPRTWYPKESKEFKRKTSKRSTFGSYSFVWHRQKFKRFDIQIPNWWAVDHDFVNRLLHDVVGSRIVETTIQISSDDAVQSVFTTYFKDNIVDLSFDVAANYPVQRILARLTRSEDISFVKDTLLPFTGDLIGNYF